MLLIMLELKGEQYHLQDSNITAYRIKRISALLLLLKKTKTNQPVEEATLVKATCHKTFTDIKMVILNLLCAKHLKGTICEVDKSVKKTKGNSNTSQKPKHVPIKLKQSQ